MIMRFLAFLLMLVFLLYIVDLSDSVTILDFHETIPFLQFGLLWTIVVLILLSPLILRQYSKRDDTNE